MLDDVRNHDPNPSEEELRWLRFDPIGGIVKLLAVAALGIAIGASVSVLVDEGAPQPASVAQSR